MSIKQRLMEMPEGGSGGNIWKPENKGEMVAGEIVRIRTAEGRFGLQTVIDIIDEEQGLLTVYAKTVIENEIKIQKAEPGDEIGIRYDGQVKNYHAFTVLVDKAQNSNNQAQAQANQQPSGDPYENTSESPPFDPF